MDHLITDTAPCRQPAAECPEPSAEIICPDAEATIEDALRKLYREPSQKPTAYAEK